MKFSPGDMIEIKTESGLFYAQVTHDHPSYPQVVRVLCGARDTRPEDIQSLAQSETAFSAMIALGKAIANKQITGSRIGSASIPEQNSEFPIFRTPIYDKLGGIAYWWFWDGKGLRYETELTPEAEKYSIREVMSADAFMHRLAR